MHTWTKIRSKLENEYLADSLKGHIRYFATSYSKCHDHQGRASILFDDKEIISGSYFEIWIPHDPLSGDDAQGYSEIINNLFLPNGTAVKYGQFDNCSFYRAFSEFDNQSIEKSLNSSNMLVRIFALLDRRVGKRTLRKMYDTINDESEVFRLVYNIRVRAEGICSDNKAVS